MSVRKSTSPKIMRTHGYKKSNFGTPLENKDPNFQNSTGLFKAHRKSTKSFIKKGNEVYNKTRYRDVGYLSLSKTVKGYKKDQKCYQGQKQSNYMQSTDGSSICMKSEVGSAYHKTGAACDREIIESLENLNKKSTNTRNSPKGSLMRMDSDFVSETEPQSFFRSLKCATQNVEDPVMMISKSDITHLWEAIEYQGQAIKNLVAENQNLTIKLKDTEGRLNSKIKDLNKNVTGINGNFESLIPIIEEINCKFKSRKTSPKINKMSNGSTKVDQKLIKQKQMSKSKEYKNLNKQKVSERV